MDVGGIINAIGSNVSSTLPSNIPTIKETVGNDGVAVDITNKGPGTYVLQFDDSSFSRNGNQGFNINKNADQNIIIYCTSTSLEIDDYQINGFKWSIMLRIQTLVQMVSSIQSFSMDQMQHLLKLVVVIVQPVYSFFQMQP